MGRQAWFLNWFWSSFLHINAKKLIIIDSTYFKKIWKFLTPRIFFPLSGLSFVAHYFVALCSNTHNKLKFSHVLLTFQAIARYCRDLQTKANMFCIIRAPSQSQSQRIVIHLARNADKGGGVLMWIILPNLNHSFISPVPVPVPVPDSGSGSGSGFPGFPYAPIWAKYTYHLCPPKLNSPPFVFRDSILWNSQRLSRKYFQRWDYFYFI